MSLNKVKEFHEKFDHPINNVKDNIPLGNRKLRLKLLFEEIQELSQAMDTELTFKELCENVISESKSTLVDGDNVDKVEELDALCDIDYVLKGAILSLGHSENFDKAFDDVHSSNMTKLCSNMEEVNETIDYYVNKRDMDKDNIIYSKVGSEYIINRKSDMKILKNVNYKSVKLEKYI